MGRIPLLLPLNVKPSEGTGQDLETTVRLQTVASLNSRRASYAYGTSENGSYNSMARAKEPRPSAASGSDAYGIAVGSDQAARTDIGPRPGREARPGVSSVVAGNSSSPSVYNDGSATGRATYSSRHTNVFGHSAVHSISSPVPTAVSCLIRPAPSVPASSSAWIASSASGLAQPISVRSPVLTVAASSTASGANSSGHSLSGMSLAQFALSSCSTAEQQLRELLDERTSPGPASPALTGPSQSSPGVTPQPLLPPPLATFRRGPVPSAVTLGPSAATSSPPLITLHPNSPSPATRLDSRRLAVSACTSPITSPIPQFGASGSSGGVGGGLLAALLDHRQALAPAHPSAARPERVTRFAAIPEPMSSNGASSGPQLGDGHGDRVLAGDGGAEAPLPPHAAALVRQLREGQDAAAVHEQHEQQELEPVRSRRAGVMWASVSPLSRGCTGEDSSQQQQQQQVHLSHDGANIGTVAPVVTAAAMRAVVELKNMDEFSLVAAARQRQQQLAQRTNMSKHPTLKNLVSATGKHSLHAHESRRILGDAALGLTLSDAHAMAMQGHHHHLTQMMLTTRTSCPEMSCQLDAPTPADTLRYICANRGAVATDGHGGITTGSGSDSATASHSSVTAATHHTSDIVGGNGSGPFLPAVQSPRHQVTSSSAHSLVTNTSNAASAAAASRASGSAPTSLTASQYLASEFPATSGLGGGGALRAVAAGPGAAEQAEAAVRALAARFGSSALPDSRTLWDQDDCDPTVRERRRKLYEALQAANPAAYHEEAAEAAEAAYRALSERAQLRLRKLLQEATTQEAPVRQLEEALRELTSQRPFFLPPVLSKPKVERTFKEADINRSKELVWNIDESLFAQRKKESESRELYDTEKVRLQQLNLDWKRVVSKARFRRMVSKGDLGVKEDGQSLDEELAEVREELQRQSDFIRAAFIYYSMTSSVSGATSAEFLQMSQTGWLAFCHDAGIVGKGCTSMDAQNIFVAVNFEEESETEESAANDDDAMVRFEFMEGLVRVAFAKFIRSKRMADASDALGVLLEEVVASPNLPPEARVDPNEWRRTQFYTPEVEELLKEYWDLLYSMFKLYKARDRARYLWPEHFMAFLESNQLLGPATGLTRRDAKLIFAWSQSLVTDELRRRQRAVSLTLWDFIEAVARVADAISPPDPEEMEQYFLIEEEQPPEPDRLAYEYYKAVGEAAPLLRRPSAGLMSAPSRPLAPKLRHLMQYLVCSLREAWGGHDAREVSAKVMRTATFLSGGIEMG